MSITAFTENQRRTNNVPRFEIDYLLKHWEAIGKVFCPSYELDELALKYINYFCKEREEFYPVLKQNPKLGLLIYGTKGAGKSLNFLIYQRFIQIHKSTLWQICASENLLPSYKDEHFFHYEDIKETEIEYKKNGVKHYDFLNSKRELVLDDIGTEPLNIKDYGTDIDFISDILRLRYNIFQKGYCITHLTTNLDITILGERYGDRILDRIKEMFIPILVECDSKRTMYYNKRKQS